MRSPSTKYLYGRASTFGTPVNVTPADYDAVDAAMRAEQRAEQRAHDRDRVRQPRPGARP